MAEIPRWFERRFDPFPVELLPNLLARLRGTPARLEEALRSTPHDVLTAKPEARWSAQENAGHLLCLEPLWLARVEDYVIGSAGLTLTDLANRPTDEARYNEHPLEEILAGFRSARVKLLKRVEELDRTHFERPIPHPRLKTPMFLADHLHFVAEHDDHHLAQIEFLTRSRS